MTRKIILSFAVFLLMGYLVYADYPPRYIKKFQAAAPEKLKIKVIEVKEKLKETEAYTTKYIDIKAKVIKVKESKYGLKRGEMILISYSNTYYFMKDDPGKPKRLAPERPVPSAYKYPVLEKGRQYFVYLKAVPTIEKKPGDPPSKSKLNPVFAPAAHRGSFVEIN